MSTSNAKITVAQDIIDCKAFTAMSVGATKLGTSMSQMAHAIRKLQGGIRVCCIGMEVPIERMCSKCYFKALKKDLNWLLNGDEQNPGYIDLRCQIR